MTRARRTGAAFAALVAVALIGAGCSSNGGSNGKPTEQTAANRDQNQINPVAYDKIKQGGTLNYPLEGVIVNFNYYNIDGNTLDTYTMVQTMLPSMFNTDAANNFTYNPDYLTGEPKLVTSPNEQITYEINPKAKWTDGTPITAQDFIAQWQANNGTNKDFTITAATGYEDVASVAAGSSPQEVVVTFKPGKTYADWKGMFSPLYPASMDASPDAFNTGWKAKPGATAGPYMFQGQDTTAQTYTLVPNPNWWGRKPKLDSIVFKVIPDVAATATALQNHEIDIDNVGPDATTYAKVKTFPGVDVRQAGGPNFRHITINGSSSELQDVNVRQALAEGIDRNAIAAAELGPLGVKDMTALNNHIFMKNQEGYQDNSGDVGKYNPTDAAAKLDAAGWVDDTSKHVRTKDGKTLQINFVIPSGVPVSADEAQLVQNQLAKIDVKVNINTVDANAFFDKYIIPGDYDFTVFSWIGSNFPISGASSIYEPEVNGNWQQNFSRVSVPEIGTLFDQAIANLDPKQAIQEANQADALIWQNVLQLPTYQRPDIWAVNSKLANIGAFGFATPDWTEIGFTS